MTCLNIGFNFIFLDDLCFYNELGVYVLCYNDMIGIYGDISILFLYVLIDLILNIVIF